MQPDIITKGLELVKLQSDIKILSEQLGNQITQIYTHKIEININACGDIKSIVDYFLEHGDWNTWDVKDSPTRFYVLNYNGLKMTVGSLTKRKSRSKKSKGVMYDTLSEMWNQHELELSKVPMSLRGGTLLPYCLSIKPIEDDLYIMANQELLAELSKVNKEIKEC